MNPYYKQLQINNQPMQYVSQGSTNPEGSLRIYEPKGEVLSKTFFNSEHQPAIKKPLSNIKSFHRHDSIIDTLENKQGISEQNSEEKYAGSSNHIKPTSIEFMVDEAEYRPINIKRQALKIEDIFANKSAHNSIQINSSLFIKPNGPIHPSSSSFLENKRSNENRIALPSFPSKQYLPDSPQKPNLARPFLRKKTTSKSSDLAEFNDALGPAGKKDEQVPFELSKLVVSIKNLKDYNNELMGVFRSLQILQEYEKDEWRNLGPKEKQMLKLMVEKAIIAKQEFH